MAESDSTRREAMLAEFHALRQETITSINARVWGILTYLAVAGGIGAWYASAPNPSAGLLLIWAALPLLWHTSLRERSRIRIGAYIEVVLEPELPGLSWERSLDAWRRQVPSRRRAIRELDKCCHILSLTGIYALGGVSGLIVLLSHSGVYWLKALGALGVLLIIVAHVGLYLFYSSGTKYKDIFENVKKELPDDPPDCT